MTQPSLANVTITPKALSVTANTATRLYGAANPALSGNVTGFVNTDTLANATTGTQVFTTTASNTSKVGNYGVNGAGLAANNGNYVFVQAAGNSTALSVTPATLNVIANDTSRLADGTAYTGGNGVVYSGFVVGDTSAALAGSLKYTGSSQGASAAGSYVIAPTGLSASNYTLAYGNGALIIKPASAAETALGGPALVAAYDSALNGVSGTSLAGGSNSNSNNNGNGNNGKPGIQTGRSLADLVNCGVLMPAGFNTNTCQQ